MARRPSDETRRHVPSVREYFSSAGSTRRNCSIVASSGVDRPARGRERQDAPLAPCGVERLADGDASGRLRPCSEPAGRAANASAGKKRQARETDRGGRKKRLPCEFHVTPHAARTGAESMRSRRRSACSHALSRRSPHGHPSRSRRTPCPRRSPRPLHAPRRDGLHDHVHRRHARADARRRRAPGHARAARPTSRTCAPSPSRSSSSALSRRSCRSGPGTSRTPRSGRSASSSCRSARTRAGCATRRSSTDRIAAPLEEEVDALVLDEAEAEPLVEARAPGSSARRGS